MYKDVIEDLKNLKECINLDIIAKRELSLFKPKHEQALSKAITLAKAFDSVEMPDIEVLSEAVHKAYCQYCIDIKGKEYWTKGDYSKLSDEVKEADRYTVRAILKIIKPKEVKE